VTPSKFLPLHSSFESIRKQAKKLVAPVRRRRPRCSRPCARPIAGSGLPLSLRDAQLVLAREYGFAGWQDLRAACSAWKARAWSGPPPRRSAPSTTTSVERLAQLIREYPALLSWRGDSGESLLGFATGSFGDSGDPYREQMFTRLECAEFLWTLGPPQTRRYGKAQFALAPRECCSSFRARGFCRAISMF
jgi:hypothetical protein